MFQISRMLRSVNLDCEKPSIEFTHSKEKKNIFIFGFKSEMGFEVSFF